MSSLKKIAWSGSAVLLALVLSLGVMAPRSAEAAASVTQQMSVTVWSGSCSAVPCPTSQVTPVKPLIVAESVVGELAVGQTIIATAPTGWTFLPAPVGLGFGAPACSGSGTLTCGAPVIAAGPPSTVTVAITAASSGTTTGSVTISNIGIQTASGSTAGGSIMSSGTATALASGTVLGTVSTSRLVVATASTTGTCGVGPLTYAAGPPATGNLGVAGVADPFNSASAQSATADGQIGLGTCAYLADTTGAPQGSVVLTFTASLGLVSTGTAKTSTATTTAAGLGVILYRGGGNTVATDTMVVSNSQLNVVGTESVNLTAPTGNTASKIVIQAPTSLAVAATVTNVSPGYVSPLQGTNFSAQVQDSSGTGVNTQVVLVSVDKGALAAGFNQSCSGVTSKSITSSTATGPLTAGGTNTSGVVSVTFCAIQTDAAGKATVTVQNISTTMANATTSISMAGRPSKIDVSATGNAISAKVSDSTGAAVADGTPVRFTMSSNAGAVSTSCTVTSNGAASAVVALIAATGTVIVSSDWNETGVAATCAAAGAQQVAASVGVPGGTATSGGGTTVGGTGTLTSGSVPATGFGLIVFGGGTIAQLVTASGVGNSGALYATVGGIFVPYVPGTTIAAVNADFLAAFPGGNIPANTAFVGRK